MRALALILLLTGCATSPNLSTEIGGETLIKEDAPKRLLACYVVLAFGEMIYTDSFYFDPRRAAEDRGNLEVAADRVRNWPDTQDWQETEARYATVTIAIALEDSLKEKALEYLSGGVSIANFRRLAGKAAVKAAVLEAFIDDIKRQRDDPDMTDDQRIDSCITRIGVVEGRLKALNGLSL